MCTFSIVTGLLIAEVNLNTMCELGSGGVSLVSMTERTLGTTGTRVATAAYIFLHYALLVAYISKGGGVVANLLHSPEWLGALAFNATLGGFCYAASSRTLDKVNGVLVIAVVATFLVIKCTEICKCKPSSPQSQSTIFIRLLISDLSRIPSDHTVCCSFRCY